MIDSHLCIACEGIGSFLTNSPNPVHAQYECWDCVGTGRRHVGATLVATKHEGDDAATWKCLIEAVRSRIPVARVADVEDMVAVARDAYLETESLFGDAERALIAVIGTRAVKQFVNLLDRGFVHDLHIDIDTWALPAT